MRHRNHMYLFSLLFAVFAGGLFFTAGCSDNPDAKAAKAVRQETSAAIDSVSRDKNYKDAQQKVEAAMERNRTQGLTRDTALLASGNLNLNQGIQRQSDLGLLVLPIRAAADDLEQLIRRSEELIIEKERIEMLLSSGAKEKADLQKLLDEGLADGPALTGLRAAAQSEMEKLNLEKSAIGKEKDKTQAVLDANQQKADDLLRQAEMAKGQEKLTLQQQAYDILKQRKEHYIQAQAADNQIAVLDGRIQLVTLRLKNLDQSIEQTKSRIDAIDHSEARQTLAMQVNEIVSTQEKTAVELTAAAELMSEKVKTYKETVDAILAVYEAAMADFEKIQSGDAAFAAALRRAETSHHAALACSALLNVQSEVNIRLVDLLQTAEQSLASAVQEKLPIKEFEETFKQKTIGLFDKAVENYQQAYEMSDRMGPDAQCSILKSHVLAVSHKMRMADRIKDFDLANQTETVLNELIKKGNELGARFTQSETMKVIANEGLDYQPELPLNMEVLVEGKQQEFNAWKRLPIAEQEAAVDSNLKQIEQLVAKYGQDLAAQLEPLKQDMTAAKERGFKEAVSPDQTTPGDPNS